MPSQLAMRGLRVALTLVALSSMMTTGCAMQTDTETEETATDEEAMGGMITRQYCLHRDSVGIRYGAPTRLVARLNATNLKTKAHERTWEWSDAGAALLGQEQ